MLRNLSTGIEASATGESLNSGDVAVHPAARHNSQHEINVLDTPSILATFVATPPAALAAIAAAAPLAPLLLMCHPL